MSYVSLLLPEFSLILLGFLLCRFTPLNRSIWSPVDALVYYLLFPTLLFYSIIKSPLDLGAASKLVGAGWSVIAAGIVLAHALPLLPGLRAYIPAREHAAAAQVAFRFNSFIGLALAERLGGPAGSLEIAVLMGVCVPLVNIAAIWPMARGGRNGLGRELVRNPLIIATVSGLLANLAGLSLPDWLAPTFNRVGASALALGLMAAGAGIQVGALARAKTLAVAVLSIRHLLLPVVALGAATAFGLSPPQATILLAYAALPTAASCYVLASKMGFDGAYVASLVSLSTLLGMLSLSLALGVLRPLYGV
ncbi:MAG: AEC family transporter [Rhodoferax sp.]|nr:AEC family transporter [Rhodoferax sp.]